MNSLALFAAVLGVGVLTSKSIGRASLSLPIVFVLAGLALGPSGLGWLQITPTATPTKEVTKITLGVLLFAEASNLGVRRVAAEANLEGRLMSAGLVLSTAVGAVIAFSLFPHEKPGVILLIAAALAPTDTALSSGIFSNQHIPARIRQSLNVESCLSDGIATPFVSLFISLAIVEGRPGGTAWLGDAVRQIVVGGAIGAAIGLIGGFFIVEAVSRDWTTMEMGKLGFFACAMTIFFAAVRFSGNPLIAAFVGGLCCSSLLRHDAHELARYAEMSAVWLSGAVWIIFGAVLVPKAIGSLFSWRAALFAILALTVMRMLPVALAMRGSSLRRDTIFIMGWFGPRGLASTVFLVTAIVAFAPSGPSPDVMIAAMTWTILLSVLLHGVTAHPVGTWYAKRISVANQAIAELNAVPDGTGAETHSTS